MGINSLDKYCIGNVLRIIDDRTIIINVGREKGFLAEKFKCMRLLIQLRIWKAAA